MTKEQIIKAELLHQWYLEATELLSPESYNAKAQVPYQELTSDQRVIDMYIAKKLETFISQAIDKAELEILYKLRTLFRDGYDFDLVVTKMIESAEGLDEEDK